MTIQVEAWQLITFFVGLLLTFFGCVGAFGKLLMGQFEKRLAEKFATQDDARSTLAKKVESLHEAQNAARIQFLEHIANLPVDYVRREDDIRNQTVLNTKLDALAARIDFLRGYNPSGTA